MVEEEEFPRINIPLTGRPSFKPCCTQVLGKLSISPGSAPGDEPGNFNRHT